MFCESILWPNSPSLRIKAIEEFQKIYNERTDFMIEDRTGFGWMYLQE